MYMGLFLDCFPVPLGFFFFMPVAYCFDYNSFVISLEIRRYDAFSFVIFSIITLAIQGLLWFHTNFRAICSVSGKMSLEY